jgi:hypothetical protein
MRRQLQYFIQLFKLLLYGESVFYLITPIYTFLGVLRLIVSQVVLFPSDNFFPCSRYKFFCAFNHICTGLMEMSNVVIFIFFIGKTTYFHFGYSDLINLGVGFSPIKIFSAWLSTFSCYLM